MNSDFRQYAEDLPDIEVGTICIDKDGNFFIRNELKGRIARVIGQRGRLREFLLDFCKRLECPDHAADPKPQAVRKARAS